MLPLPLSLYFPFSFHNTADITSELECQHRGGTCEFFVGCWVTGGLLQGTCNGLLRGCCHRTAKSANLRTSEYVGHTIDLTDLPQKNYGPVKNDPSECYETGKCFSKKNKTLTNQ